MDLLLVSEQFLEAECLELSQNVASILSINSLGKTISECKKFETGVHFSGLQLLMD